MNTLTITEYTDPACPFAWSAEPSRWRLRWLYGDQLDWRPRMVGLSESSGEYEQRGFTPARFSASLQRLAHAHGMPMDTAVRPRMAASLPACRAVVATRVHAPEREKAILRNLRVLHFSANLLDEPATLAAAARRSGIDADELGRWLAEPETERQLREDLDQARQPTPEALALEHKLADTDDGGHRYTCPSYEIVRTADGASLSVPGFQPATAYEVAIANLGPELLRRGVPDDVTVVLEWAGVPLASAEVAAVCELDLDDAREQLGRVAHEHHLGPDGLWSLDGTGG